MFSLKIKYMSLYLITMIFLYCVAFPGATFAQSKLSPQLSSDTQSSQGNQSPNQINKNGTNFANYGILVNGTYTGSTPIAKNSSLDAKKEALFLVQHPTVLEVSDLRWSAWFGDSVPFLDVELTNKSDLPAFDVHVTLLDNRSGGTLKKLKPYKLSKSYAMKILQGTAINIGANSKWQWPLSSVADVETIVNSNCISGAGMGYKPVRAAWMEGANGSSQGGESGIYIKVEYKTIFGEKLAFIVSGVIDTMNRGSDYMVLRGAEKAVPLKCVGDKGWNTTELTN